MSNAIIWAFSALSFALLLFALFVLPRILKRSGKAQMSKGDCELLAYPFYLTNSGAVLYNRRDYNPANATPIQVLEVSEITQNSYLVQLEIRFLMDGAIKSERIKGTADQLLTIKYKLGYGG